MNPDLGRLCQRLKRHWLNGLLAAGLAFGLQVSAGHAEDGFHDHAMKPANWHWWHAIWFQKDGTPRYGGGLGGMSRQHAPRLMPRPPLCQPEYGYYQPCWRQLPVTPRCYTCETVPANYAVPSCEPIGFDLVPPPPAPSTPAKEVVPEIPRPELAEEFTLTTATDVPVPENFGFSTPLPRTPIRGEWAPSPASLQPAKELSVPGKLRRIEQGGTPE
ncbi:MAG TPA: hypothetical protein VM165_22805 [Planctomycetaceae bacterium]|nr:hypothetical protein [Planctomycetaceae bacterium]